MTEVEPRLAKRDHLRAKIADPDGEAWRARARAKWEAADSFEAYDPEPLPDWREGAPVHVTRKLFGRFLIDRDTRTVHDCYAATPACEIDGIRNGTFVHFLSELLETVDEETPCASCIEA